MDAGVLQLHVFPHQRAFQSARLLEQGESLVPTLTADSSITTTAAVSLIIPTFFNDNLKNRSLRHTLDGIGRSNCIDEIVLVSGDAADGQTQVDAVDKRLVRIPAEPNRRARTRNLGAAAARNELLLFLDDDMVVRDWRAIDAIVSALYTEDYDCALFPRRHYARFPLLYDQPALADTIGQWRAGNENLDDTRLFDPLRHGCPFTTMAFCFPGCFMLIRRESFDLLGGFPEEFEGWGFEDSDFAMRAAAVLRVLNLFRKSDPFLHIDHPVSPYKSEEYQQNFHRFVTAHAMGDVDRLCRSVIRGEDFNDSVARPSAAAETRQPLQRILESPDLPLAGDETATREVIRNYEQILEFRFEKSNEPIPEWIVLHGSRGAGRPADGSDFDVLFLFRGGQLREFFTCETSASKLVELEFSDCSRFESISMQPVFHPRYGPLELAKLAAGKVLYGDESEWRDWVSQLLQIALEHGRLYWTLYAVGMSLRPEKNGVFRERFVLALNRLLARRGVDAPGDELTELAELNSNAMLSWLRSALDAQFPSWRDDLAQGRRLFAYQVPEVWTAMRWLIDSQNNECRARRP